MAKKRSKKRSIKKMACKTIDLKALCKAKDERGIRNALKKACESEVAIIVHNAPFAVA